MPQSKRNQTSKKGSKVPAKKSSRSSKSTKSQPKRFLSPKSKFSPQQLAGLVMAFVAVGIFVVFLTHAATDTKLQKFVNNPGRGWVWDGLREAKVGSNCKGAVEVVHPKTGEAMGCTHGPDPAPLGVDV